MNGISVYECYCGFENESQMKEVADWMVTKLYIEMKLNGKAARLYEGSHTRRSLAWHFSFRMTPRFVIFIYCFMSLLCLCAVFATGDDVVPALLQRSLRKDLALEAKTYTLSLVLHIDGCGSEIFVSSLLYAPSERPDLFTKYGNVVSLKLFKVSVLWNQNGQFMQKVY